MVAGSFLQLFLGMLYTWSVFATPIAEAFSWNIQDVKFTVNIMLCCYSLGVLVGGRLQGKLKAPYIVLIGGLMMAVGMLVTSILPAGAPVWCIWLTYGVIGGFGVGLAYNTIIASSQKWFPAKRGLATGIAAAEALVAEVYTEATWADMQAALAAAKAVLTSEDQAEVDAAVAALNAAVAALEKLPAADILKIDFTAPNAVKGAVEDDELANIYLGKVTYDLGLGGVEGKISFNQKTGLATTKKDSATDEALACGIRMFFYAKDAANLINGTDYNFLKVRFKANHPITDTTIVAIRDAATHWHYYGAAYKLNKVGDWYEALIDLNANHMESPMGSIKDAVLGEGDTFCVEFLDVGSFGANREWADSYGDGLEISLESLTFFANEDDAKDSLTAPDTGMGADYTALLVCLMVLSAMAVIVVASKRRKTR